MGGLSGYVEFILKKEKRNLKEVHMKRSSRVELKAEKTLRTRAVAGWGGRGGGSEVGAVCRWRGWCLVWCTKKEVNSQ